MQELGATGRGEDMEIGTFIEKSVDHELSGNVIDLCPVGALNSKPFRHRARSWEMTEHALVSPHDGTGTNLWGHVLRGRLMRVVPRDQRGDQRDLDRGPRPLLVRGRLRGGPAARADDARGRAAGRRSRLGGARSRPRRRCCARRVKEGGAGRLGFLAAPGSTNEEAYLLARLARGLGSHNVDSRLRQLDFSDQANDPAYPGLGIAIARHRRARRASCSWAATCASEAPILAHRVRKAALAGCKVSLALDAARRQCHFPVLQQTVAAACRPRGGARRARAAAR